MRTVRLVSLRGNLLAGDVAIQIMTEHVHHVIQVMEAIIANIVEQLLAPIAVIQIVLANAHAIRDGQDQIVALIQPNPALHGLVPATVTVS